MTFLESKIKNQKLRIMKQFIGKKCIIRSYGAGVFFGTLDKIEKDNTCVVLSDVRRIHYWDGAASLSQLATEGVKNPGGCRFSVTVPSCAVTGVIEIIPCSDKAIENIMSVPIWRL